jgi:hypothetical protein
MRKMSIREQMEFEAVALAGPEAVKRFERLVADGESVSMASMLATRSPPRTGITDQTYHRNSPGIGEIFKNEPEMLDLYRKNYRACTGEDLPDDAVPFRGLVDFPGDPGAIITHKHSLQDVKRVMHERNRHVEGDWEHHQYSQAPTPQVTRMSDMVMNRYKGEYRAEDEFRDMSEPELEEVILDTHAPVVTPDQAMAAPTSVHEAMQRARGLC